jgi:hypothetical protein
MSSTLYEPELDESGEVKDKRPYYCPECGLRYETPGVCSGRDEGGHAPAGVEKTSGKAKADDAGDKPKPAAKRKTSTTRKRKTAGASK